MVLHGLAYTCVRSEGEETGAITLQISVSRNALTFSTGLAVSV